MNISITTYFDHISIPNLSSDEKSEVVRNNVVQDFENIFGEIQEEEFHFLKNITYLPDIIPSHSLLESEEEIKQIIPDTLIACHEYLPRKNDIYVMITPTFYSEYLEEMGGVMGFAPRIGNLILIAINTDTPDWKHELRSTIAHEYHHTVIHENQTWDTFQDILVYEGLAEHFRNIIVSEKRSDWTILDEKGRNHIISFWHHFEHRLEKSSFAENSGYYEYFIGGDDNIPYQLGYSLGYLIIDDYLKEHDRDLIRATHTDPKTIIEWWTHYRNIP